MPSISVSRFNSRSLGLIERMTSYRVGQLVLIKGGRPVTAAVPMREEHEPVEFWGALRELVELVDGVNLTASTSEIWVAERG